MSNTKDCRSAIAVGLVAMAIVACDNKPSGGSTANSAPPSASVASVPLGASAASASASAASAAPGADKDPLSALPLGTIFRDDEDLTLDGVKETWRLEWTKPPTPDCMGPAWSTCTCAGFAFGERGSMDLVRAIPGKPEERLRLDSLFADNDTRMQRWPTTTSDSNGASAEGGAKPVDLVDVAMRPVTSIIKFADFDHDGRASEFLLQIDAGPCGHTPTIVVGVSKSNGKLHAFGTAEKPTEPFALPRASDWEKLKSKGNADIVMVGCGDHGATEQTLARVSADGQLHAKTETKKCP